ALLAVRTPSRRVGAKYGGALYCLASMRFASSSLSVLCAFCALGGAAKTTTPRQAHHTNPCRTLPGRCRGCPKRLGCRLIPVSLTLLRLFLIVPAARGRTCAAKVQVGRTSGPSGRTRGPPYELFSPASHVSE